MKPLAEMNSADKARLLHSLFPDEMPDLIEFIAGMAETTKEDGELLRPNWNDSIFSVDDWLWLAGEVGQAIIENKARLSRNGDVFADQLFDWLLSLFTIHCITSYTQVREHPNPKFTKAVDLFFNP